MLFRSVRYFPLDAARVWSRACSTRIAEVEDPGKLSEHEKPVGRDRGYLWLLNTYGRSMERDGGVHIQIESIALSRSIPTIFAWLVNPYLKSVPRDYLTHLLEATRKALPEKKDGASPGRPSSAAGCSRLSGFSGHDLQGAADFPDGPDFFQDAADGGYGRD